MKSKWIDHKGRKIMYCDYSNFKLNIDGLKAEVAAAEAVVYEEPPNSVLELVDIRNTVVSIDVTNLFKKVAKNAKPYIRKTAVVGITGLTNIMAQAVSRFSDLDMTMFDDIETAKDWLIS